jgi:hypothetical protein
LSKWRICGPINKRCSMQLQWVGCCSQPTRGSGSDSSSSNSSNSGGGVKVQHVHGPYPRRVYSYRTNAESPYTRTLTWAHAQQTVCQSAPERAVHGARHNASLAGPLTLGDLRLSLRLTSATRPNRPNCSAYLRQRKSSHHTPLTCSHLYILPIYIELRPTCKDNLQIVGPALDTSDSLHKVCIAGLHNRPHTSLYV